jgi:hypothetical protein
VVASVQVQSDGGHSHVIRNYLTSDEPKLRAIFKAQGFEYEWPNLNSPLFLSKIVLEERNYPVAAICSRLTAEEYFLADKDWGTPEMRWQAFLELHEAARADLFNRGLEDCYCWIPPQIERPFGRRLFRLGWTRNVWSAFNRQLGEPTKDSRQTCVYSPELSSTLARAL